MNDLSRALALVSDARREYDLYVAECRACGYEVPTFEEFCGVSSPKADAQERWRDLEARDELDLY